MSNQNTSPPCDLDGIPKPLSFPSKPPGGIWRQMLCALERYGLCPSKDHDIKIQLLARNTNTHELWSPALRNIHIEASKIIMKHMGWPNNFYIPDDPCRHLFWSGLGLQNADCLMEIGKKFEMPNQWIPSWTPESRYIDLIEEIKLLKNTGKQ